MSLGCAPCSTSTTRRCIASDGTPSALPLMSGSSFSPCRGHSRSAQGSHCWRRSGVMSVFETPHPRRWLSLGDAMDEETLLPRTECAYQEIHFPALMTDGP